MKNRRGQILLFLLIFLGIIGILSASLATVWRSGININELDRNKLAAFYMAQAGLERAKIEAIGGTTSGWFPCSDVTNLACWQQEAGHPERQYMYFICRSACGVGGPNTSQFRSRGRVVRFTLTGAVASVLAVHELQTIIDVTLKVQDPFAWRSL